MSELPLDDLLGQVEDAMDVDQSDTSEFDIENVLLPDQEVYGADFGSRNGDNPEVESFSNAGEIFQRGVPQFQTSVAAGNGNPFYPFLDAGEFEIVNYLNNLALWRVDSFVSLKWVGIFIHHT